MTKNYFYLNDFDIKSSVFVFDLDDTLYSELTFKISAISYIYFSLNNFSVSLNHIIEDHHNWIENLLKFYTGTRNISKDFFLNQYRMHNPIISLYSDSNTFLKKLKSLNSSMALVTDGRSVTQRNKISSLGLSGTFQYVLISEEFGSEKPSLNNFKEIEKRFPQKKYLYFADNTKKDFIAPNHLGWETVCLLDRGSNIHSQDFSLPPDYLPNYTISSFYEIEIT